MVPGAYGPAGVAAMVPDPEVLTVNVKLCAEAATESDATHKTRSGRMTAGTKRNIFLTSSIDELNMAVFLLSVAHRGATMGRGSAKSGKTMLPLALLPCSLR